MTQSGQRDEQQPPAARPAHEGIVLPADGSPPVMPGATVDQTGPAGGQSWGQPWGPGAGQPEPQRPPEAASYGSYGDAGAYDGYGAPQAQPLPPHQPQHQLPPQQPQHQLPPPQHQQPPQYQQQPPHQLPPQPQHQLPPQPYGAPQGGSYGAQPLPAEAHLPPGGGDETQFIPPVPAAGAADATQYIPPVPPGGLPPERPAESTQYLGAVRPAPDADATQFIAPVPAQAGPHDIPAVPPGGPYGIRPGAPGDRTPPAEFDSLFRTEGPGAGHAPNETQQLPQFDNGPRPGPGPVPTQGHGQGHGRGTAPQGRAATRRKSSPLPLIAAVVVGCAILGLGAGALMSGGDDEQDKNETVASESSSPGSDTKTAADPAQPQAEALDKLLAESNDSRAAVISAVESIKTCENLDKAVTDLKGAAQQRRDLVTRLQELTLDQLPKHGALSSSLTEAWRASASADDHYATWAGEAKTKKGCRGGKARTTEAASEGNRASGEATSAKQRASGLWNGIATTYDLTKRAPTEL